MAEEKQFYWTPPVELNMLVGHNPANEIDIDKARTHAHYHDGLTAKFRTPSRRNSPRNRAA
jgi:hypothetical protein